MARAAGWPRAAPRTPTRPGRRCRRSAAASRRSPVDASRRRPGRGRAPRGAGRPRPDRRAKWRCQRSCPMTTTGSPPARCSAAVKQPAERGAHADEREVAGRHRLAAQPLAALRRARRDARARHGLDAVEGAYREQVAVLEVGDAALLDVLGAHLQPDAREALGARAAPARGRARRRRAPRRAGWSRSPAAMQASAGSVSRGVAARLRRVCRRSRRKASKERAALIALGFSARSALGFSALALRAVSRMAPPRCSSCPRAQSLSTIQPSLSRMVRRP